MDMSGIKEQLSKESLLKKLREENSFNEYGFGYMSNVTFGRLTERKTLLESLTT